MSTETFEEILFTPETESSEGFPSPETLKRKILISTKPQQVYLDSETGKFKDLESQKGLKDD